MSAPAPTFVLLPGAGGESWYWHLVAARLRDRGHEVVSPDLPAGDDGAGLAEYAEGPEHERFIYLCREMGVICRDSATFFNQRMPEEQPSIGAGV